MSAGQCCSAKSIAIAFSRSSYRIPLGFSAPKRGDQMKISKMLVAACAIKPQQAISLSEETMNAQSGRVGVMMTKLPAVDTHLPGAGCLLSLAAASAANSSLTAHAKTLSYEDLPQL